MVIMDIRKKILFITALTLLISCGKKERTPQQKQEIITEIISEELDYNVDKIVLLSNIENLPIKKVNATIQGYFNAIYDTDFDLESVEDYQNLINNISKNTGLSTKRVASIIFAYVYEMRTKEEIGDEYIDKLEEEQEQYNEVYDPR